MKPFVHLVANENAAATLRRYLSSVSKSDRGDTVKCFLDDLSIGPMLPSFDTRMHWFYERSKDQGFNESYSSFSEEFQESYQSMKEEYKHSSCVLWHGPNVQEQCALRYMAYHVDCTDLYEMDLSKVFPLYRSTAEISPEEMNPCVQAIVPVEIERAALLKQEGLEIERDGSRLRILEGGKIVAVPDDHYDAHILSIAQKGAISALRLAGKVMHDEAQTIGDFYLLYRIQVLLQAKKLRRVDTHSAIHQMIVEIDPQDEDASSIPCPCQELFSE